MLTLPTYLRLFLLGPWLWLLSGSDPVTPVAKPMIDYTTEWRKADSLMARGLPKSALEIADRLYAEAKKNNHQPQLLKAAMRRVVFRTQAANDEETYVTLTRELTTDIGETSGATRAVSQSVLAEVYWRFYQHNRYRFLNRTSTAPAADISGPDSTDTTVDPRTWDARRLMQTITRLYQASVEPPTLRQTALGTYDVVLASGNEAGRGLRPTLYDVLAHRAIDFFANTETELTRPVEAFDLNDPDYLGDAEVFVRKTIPATDTLSGKYQALVLYQQLLRFHLSDKNPLVLAVADVERLQFVRQASTLPNERYLLEQTLRRQIARYKGNVKRENAAEADYTLALIQLLAQPEGGGRRYYRETLSATGNDDSFDTTRRWDRRTAAGLARELIARFPASYPAQQARPLLRELLQPALTMQVEEVNEPAKPFRARVDFRNVKTLFYKILRLSPDELQQLETSNYEESSNRDRWFAALQNHKVVAQGQLNLPDDGDLRMHSVEVPIGALPLGHYVLLASNEGRFAKPGDGRDEIVSIGKVIVSRLAYLIPGDYHYNTTGSGLLIVDRQSGMPLAGVSGTVMARREQATTTKYVVGSSQKTDAQGRLLLSPSQLPAEQSYRIRFTNGDDVLDTQDFYRYNRPSQAETPEEADQAVIFTDRAIYRPGQTVHFKALVYGGSNNEFTVRPNESITVRFTDVNGEEIGQTTLRTNEFGTAAGTFTAPMGRLTGQMTLLIDKVEGGRATVQVEEYKRPTFAVVAEPLKQAPTLGQTVTVRATAKTLAGAVVDGASVAYRVTRQYVQPYWRGWRSYRPGNDQEIANGTTATNPDGTLSLTFTAVADPAIAVAEKPRFTYTVTIDVTDRSGETRSTTQTLSIGYTALSAALTLPDPVLTSDRTKYAVVLTNASQVAVPLKSGSPADGCMEWLASLILGAHE